MPPQSITPEMILAGLLSAPVILAAIRAFVHYGRQEARTEQLTTTVTQFTERIEGLVADHEKRITTIEAERRAEARLARRHVARRMGDPEPTDEHQLPEG